MSELSLPLCPICHARDSQSRETLERAGQAFTWYECQECGSSLLWVGDDSDAGLLLDWALGHQGVRVVVKRPQGAPTLGHGRPATIISGKNSRFDIYLPGRSV